MVKFEILEHELVPKFSVLTKEEGEVFKHKYGIKKEDLPWIKNSDPICMRLREKQKEDPCPKCGGKMAESIEEGKTKGVKTMRKVIKCEKCSHIVSIIGPGQILKIERKSQVAGHMIAYRYIVPR